MTDKIDREIMQQALDALIENARLLGITQAKRGYGFYSQEDAIFERAFHECIAKHSAVLLERLAQPERERMSKMTDRELLEQAHDALYKEDRISGYANYGKLRKALRERLAQPDPRNQCGETCERAKLCAVCLAEMGSQPASPQTKPEQEPVAYVLRTLSGKSISDEIAPTGWSTFESKIEKLRADPWVQNGIAEIVPLYTSPQQREWKGLTEKEMKKLADTHLVHQPESYEMSGVFDLIRAVSEKLEEKND
ncbi:MAG: hypothetical protein ACK5QN_07585 [Burkholderiales bacterium]|jgi:hypothetical protein